MQYGIKPKDLGLFDIKCDQMMFYQYLPIKLINQHKPTIEERLMPYEKIIGTIFCDFIGEFGLDKFISNYSYLTVKNIYQTNGCSFNRMGYHSDGFLTNDINYIWSDKSPTVFNFGNFNISNDDDISLIQMQKQAKKRK